MTGSNEKAANPSIRIGTTLLFWYKSRFGLFSGHFSYFKPIILRYESI